mgnify:FL=1
MPALPLRFLLTGTLTAWAVRPEYSPFEDSEKPQPFKVTQLTYLEPSTRDSRRFARQGETNPVITISWTTNGDCLLGLSPPATASTLSWQIDGYSHAVVGAYTADLNKDTVTDYMTLTASGGCGLAAEISFMTFVLSCPTGYVAHCVYSFAAEPSDLVDINHDGKPEYLHTMFVYGENGRDGKAHNYWVYNLLGFSGTDIISANAADSRFPKWIWYTFKPNHADTDQLIGEQRTRLWREEWEHRLHDRSPASFPNPELFAPEQGVPHHARALP